MTALIGDVDYIGHQFLNLSLVHLPNVLFAKCSLRWQRGHRRLKCGTSEHRQRDFDRLTDSDSAMFTIFAFILDSYQLRLLGILRSSSRFFAQQQGIRSKVQTLSGCKSSV